MPLSQWEKWEILWWIQSLMNPWDIEINFICLFFFFMEGLHYLCLESTLIHGEPDPVKYLPEKFPLLPLLLQELASTWKQ